jgi:hypothetical protein
LKGNIPRRKRDDPRIEAHFSKEGLYECNDAINMLRSDDISFSQFAERRLRAYRRKKMEEQRNLPAQRAQREHEQKLEQLKILQRKIFWTGLKYNNFNVHKPLDKDCYIVGVADQTHYKVIPNRETAD